MVFMGGILGEEKGVGIREAFDVVVMNKHYVTYSMVIACGKVYGLFGNRDV
jgi:predicted transcriptional regulator